MLAVSSTLTAFGITQQQFAEMGKRTLPVDLEAENVVVEDIDGDGDSDVFFCVNGQNRLLRNDGPGRLTEVTATHLPAASCATTSAAFADVDGDGDPDLVTGNTIAGGNGAGDSNRLWLNDGSGQFAAAPQGQLPQDSDLTMAVLFADVDVDGDPDLFVANAFRHRQGQCLRLYENTSGSFVDVTTTALPACADSAMCLAYGDVDGDGYGDLAVGRTLAVQGGQNQDLLLRNDGAGMFLDATNRWPAPPRTTLTLAMLDVDGDGDLDLFEGHHGSLPSVLWLNDGSGYFGAAPATYWPGPARIAGAFFGDIDGDNDPDVVLGGIDGVTSPFLPGNARVFLNQGTAFVDASAASLIGECSELYPLGLEDIDGDGDRDVLAHKLCLNDGTGTFFLGSGARRPFLRDALAIGDVDGDGDPDLVTDSQVRGPGPMRLLRNDGTGAFDDVTTTQVPSAPGGGSELVLVDVDLDGDLDLIVGSSVWDMLWINSGGGVFVDETAARMPFDADRATAIRVADVDGDSWPDLIVGVLSGQNRLLRNLGGGYFVDATSGNLPAIVDATSAMEVGDVDGDGDVDLVVGNGLYERNVLLRNDGTGSFSDAGWNLPPFHYSTGALALADLDGDGDLDLAVGNDGQDRLFLNDGAGVFSDATATRMPFDDDVAGGFAAFDADGDGLLDLAVSNYWGRNRLLLQRPWGMEDASGRLPFDDDHSKDIVVGDLDGDGDPDLVFGNEWSDGSVLFNLRRQLEAPYVLHLGRNYDLEAHARFGPASSSVVAYPFLSTVAAQIALPPYGTLGIDPTQMMPLPPIVLPPSGGTASLSLPIPAAPGFVGMSVRFQAVMLRDPLQFELTNTIVDTFLR